ncbi:MAG TPA: MarR family winged helix-turn-helix transcriptional regulator [Streptosporangiaceae bacterium]|nr:MarR family winged helix-turn-helix transcriptional regulator [Streptosporangiaceae bacterium]
MTTTTRRALADSLPHQLRRATQACSVVWQQHMPDLTPPQFAVLFALAEHVELDQSTLGALTSIDRSTLTPLLDRLENRGLISKTIDPANRRRRLATITEPGRACFAQASDRTTAIHQWIIDTLGADGTTQLTELLRALGDSPPHSDQTTP